MNDILFDVVTREMVMQNNDFAITSNPSIQNGGIIQYSRCSFLSTPMLGIGMEDLINSATVKTAYEMNRWQQQCKQDTATIAKWTATQTGQVIKINIQISYE